MQGENKSAVERGKRATAMLNDAAAGRWHELNSVECAIAAAFAAGVDLERAMERAYEDFTMVQRSFALSCV